MFAVNLAQVPGVEDFKTFGPVLGFILVSLWIFGKFIMPNLRGNSLVTETLITKDEFQQFQIKNLEVMSDISNGIDLLNRSLTEANHTLKTIERLQVIMSTKLNGTTHKIAKEFEE